MRSLARALAAVMVVLVPVLVTAAPLPESKTLRVAGEGCRCHDRGYPRCDCGQGEACRCITLSGNPLPLAARLVLDASCRRFSGIYQGEGIRGEAVTVVVLPLREPNHYLATWHYDGRAGYQSMVQRVGLTSAVERWRSLDFPESKGSSNWEFAEGGAYFGASYFSRSK